MGMKRSHAEQWAASTFLMKWSMLSSAHSLATLAFSLCSDSPWRPRLRTPSEVLLSVHLANGGAVVLHLADPLLRLLELVLQIFLQKDRISKDCSGILAF